MRDIVPPLLDAFRVTATDPDRAARLLDGIAGRTHCIGGSVAQRDVITKTRAALETSTS